MALQRSFGMLFTTISRSRPQFPPVDDEDDGSGEDHEKAVGLVTEELELEVAPCEPVLDDQEYPGTDEAECEGTEK